MTDNNLLAFLTFTIAFIITLRADELTKINLYEGHVYDSFLQSLRNLETNSLPFSLFHSASVPVNLGEVYHEKNKPFSQPYLTMTISISSNESGLFGDFMNSNYTNGFSCQSSYCTQDNVSREYLSSWIMGTASSITINTTLSIADGAWQLQIPALYFSEMPSIIAYRAYLDIGWIGLGTGLGADKNFQNKNPIFSILTNPLSGAGSLIFGFNSSLADMSKRPQIMTSDPSWRMNLSSISVKNSIVFSVDGSDLGSISVEFDLTMQQASFPLPILKSIVNEMKKQGGDCNGKICISHDIRDLPPIIFTFFDGTQLTIGAEIYMIQHKNDDMNLFYTINFATKSHTKYGINHIILGKHILYHFYSVFQCVDGANTISLYTIASNTTPQEDKQLPTEPVLSDSSTSGIIHTKRMTFIVISLRVLFLLLFCGLGILGVKKGWFRKGIVWSHIDLELQEQETEDRTIDT